MKGLASVTSLVGSDLPGDLELGYCALLISGDVECWGDNTMASSAPVRPLVPIHVGALLVARRQSRREGPCLGRDSYASAGDGFCAILSSGGVDCWGDNYYGDLGDGTSSGPDTCHHDEVCSTAPVVVQGLASVASLASGGGDGYCSSLTSGGVDCWGANYYGELGDGTSSGPDTCSDEPCSTIPVAVKGLPPESGPRLESAIIRATRDSRTAHRVQIRQPGATVSTTAVAL